MRSMVEGAPRHTDAPDSQWLPGMSKSVTGPEADAASVFVLVRRYPPPGTGVSGIVPRVGRGAILSPQG